MSGKDAAPAGSDVITDAAILPLNDGSDRAPRLEVFQSWWGMIGLGRGSDGGDDGDGGGEWTVGRKLDLIAENGFAGIMGRLPYPLGDAAAWRAQLDARGLKLGLHAFAASGAELSAFLDEIAPIRSDFVNAHILDAFVVGEEAEALIREMLAIAAERGMPMFVETHRGRVTEDLIRTARYVDAIPELGLTIDLSHYAVGGELDVFPPAAERLIGRLLTRTHGLHGRISNGQQVQIDIGNQAEHPLVGQYVRMWTEGMAHWLKGAGPGDILPVLPELGPPPYAIVADGREISDRWTQALLIKGLFERAWQAALLQQASLPTSN